jgi:hypothetical protein
MIEHNAGALEEVTRAHSAVKDSVADVDRTIKTILEVSRDLRQMTGSLGTAFSWFDEALRITDAGRREEQGDAPQGAAGAELALARSEMLEPESVPQHLQMLDNREGGESAGAAEGLDEEVGELEPLEPEGEVKAEAGGQPQGAAWSSPFAEAPRPAAAPPLGAAVAAAAAGAEAAAAGAWTAEAGGAAQVEDLEAVEELEELEALED